MVKVVIVGAGDRGNVYARYALSSPDKMKVVGIVEPDPVRNELMAEKYSLPAENCFFSADDFLKREVFADAVINGTMDQLHVPTSIPILKKGYHILLEKPLAVNEDEMAELVGTVKETGKKVYICHVLRYAPFYRSIKEHILSGEIGKIINVQLDEHVSYHHMAVAFVRGKWRSKETCYADMLLAKSCHDIDLMLWMLSETDPCAVSSFGSDLQFGPDKKPEGAGTRCMLDCPYNDTCIFSAESNYVEPQRWDHYVWQELEKRGFKWEHFSGLTPEQREILKDSLNTCNDYGRCVWDFPRGDNVDHQSVLVSFKNGATGTLNMVGGAAAPGRTVKIIGTRGELICCGDERHFKVRVINPKTPCGYNEYTVDSDDGGERSSHGGGDQRLVADFCRVLEGGGESVSCTDINDSIKCYNVVFAAERSRISGETVRVF